MASRGRETLACISQTWHGQTVSHTVLNSRKGVQVGPTVGRQLAHTGQAVPAGLCSRLHLALLQHAGPGSSSLQGSRSPDSDRSPGRHPHRLSPGGR